jgi:hypothetical protein
VSRPRFADGGDGLQAGICEYFELVKTADKWWSSSSWVLVGSLTTAHHIKKTYDV